MFYDSGMSSATPMSSHFSTAFLAIPPMPHAASLKSARSSGSSTTSSLSSTFSDLTECTSASYSSSPPNAKTNAFFASPFSTRPPSPVIPASPPPNSHPVKPRSLTADFFATPVRSPSPPISSSKSSTQTIPDSRIFPSRYTSSVSGRRSPEFSLISNLDTDGDSFYSHRTHGRTPSSSSEESSSFTSSSSFSRTRLPTPPPSPLHREDTIMPFTAPPSPSAASEQNDDEPTPRPADLKPSPMLQFERSLLLQRQARAKAPPPLNPPPAEEDSDDGVDDEANEPQPGTIISLPALSQLPFSPLSLTFPITLPPPNASSTYNKDRGTATPTNDRSTSLSALFAHSNGQPSSSRSPSPPLYPPLSNTQPPLSSSSTAPPSQDGSTSDQTQPHESPQSQLRLVRPLGHGAFSAVWLAEDLSKVPLAIVSRRSVRDLRRMASEKDKDREKRGDRNGRATNGRKGGGQAGMVEGGVENDAEDTAATPTIPASTPEPKANRQPSRLRGLRNMLSFSRQSSVSSIPTPMSPTSPTTSAHSHPPSAYESSEGAAPSSLSRTSSAGSEMSLRSNATDGPARAAVRAWRFPATQEPHDRVHTPEELAQMSLSRDSSLRKFRARVRGTRPAVRFGRNYLDERDGEMGEPRRAAAAGGPRSALDARAGVYGGMSESEDEGTELGLGASLSRTASLSSVGRAASSYGRLVAVKMTPRRPPRANWEAGAGAHSKGRSGRGSERQVRREEEERTRVGFVREVEVLKHISHPNITPLLAHLSSSTHHILVLPYLPGGDLLGLVNSDVAWGKLGESVLRRIWYELCKAVGWMHGVGLVHRDIKLENILLTTPTFSSLNPLSPTPKLDSLPLPPAPFIKLTDFGLSRFVEIDANGDAELLSTRCGSEAYAAPELVTGGGGGGRGVYDARKTDAWACGVVLYALVGRQLPFGEGVLAGAGGGAKIGGERGAVGGVPGSAAERRHWLVRIARGEWEWPGGDDELEALAPPSAEEPEELVGPHLVRSRGARRLVSRLLVRDPKKRARIGDLWDDVWMCSAGDEAYWRKQENEDLADEIQARYAAMDEGVDADAQSRTQQELDGGDDPWGFNPSEFGGDVDMGFYDEPTGVEPFGLEGEDAVGDAEDEEEEEVDGCLFDQEGIDSITRQEVV